ncbi:precorrin-3B C(17)-methyltransferase [Lacrimispora sp. BS-2]|uniref:Precorrin-3B C(17)-methyltransferase n=1 Tax=Lacrimispora sp. BS-2 TaxID=3151850 RepID=A0AAU7PVK4_9FIRM
MTKSGKLYVVGIGPGSYEDMTIRAIKALKESEVIVGYTVYIDLIKEHFPHKEMLTTPMRREQDRCQMAIDEAKKGKTAAMVCSGDSGVYGMSGLILEMARQEESLEIEIIPGVTAALSGGAVLGAPLGHDFAVISLSDLLTPMELIEDRLRSSAQADMVICLYNPSSKKRAGYLKRACEIAMEYKSRSTICGFVKNIGRKEEEMAVMTLETLKDTQTDMFTTVYIGNSMTKLINGRMVTPRGYKNV